MPKSHRPKDRQSGSASGVDQSDAPPLRVSNEILRDMLDAAGGSVEGVYDRIDATLNHDLGLVGELLQAAQVPEEALDLADGQLFARGLPAVRLAAGHLDAALEERTEAVDMAEYELAEHAPGRQVQARANLGLMQSSTATTPTALATKLTPSSYMQTPVAGIAPPSLESSGYGDMEQAVEAAAGASQALLDAADQVRLLGDGAAATDPDSAFAAGSQLALGPFSTWAGTSGQATWLRHVLGDTAAGPMLGAVVDQILGRDPELAAEDANLFEESWSMDLLSRHEISMFDVGLWGLAANFASLVTGPERPAAMGGGGLEDFSDFGICEPEQQPLSTAVPFGPWQGQSLYGPDYAPDTPDLGPLPTTSGKNPLDPKGSADHTRAAGMRVNPQNEGVVDLLDGELRASPDSLGATGGVRRETRGHDGRYTSEQAGAHADFSGESIDLMGSMGRESGTRDEDGALKNSSRATMKGGVKIKEDGFQATKEASYTVTDDKGTATAGKIGGGLDSDGTLSANASLVQTDKDGKAKGGGAGGEFGPNGYSASGFAQYGRVKVSVKHGRKARFLPVEDLGNGQFRVRYGIETSTGGSGGATSGDLGKGKAKVGGSGGASMSNEVVGSRLFKSRQQALDFVKGADLGDIDEGKTGIPQSAASALELAEGEVRGLNEGVNYDASASVSQGMVGAGVSATKSSETGLSVERGPRKTVLVEIRDQGMIGGGGFLSVGAVSAGKSRSSGEIESVLVVFDLSTQAGEKAYEYFAEAKKLPPSPAGYHVKTQTKAEVESHGTSLKAPIISMADRSTMIDGITKNDDGSKQEFSVGSKERGISAKLAWWDLGHYNEKHQMSAVEVDDKDRYYTATSAVDTDDAQSAYEGMWEATHRDKRSRDLGGDSKGKWSVTSVFTEEEVDRFTERMNTGLATPDRHIEGDVEDEAMGLLKSTDPDKRRRGLAMYVAEGGRYALSDLRAGAAGSATDPGHEGQEYHVALEGDAYWTGFLGARMTEAEITAYRQRLDQASDFGSLRGLVDELGHSIAWQEERRGALPGYKEVPGDLVAQEIDRTETWIATLVALRSQAASSDVTDDTKTESTMALQEPTLVAFVAADGAARTARSQAEPARIEAYKEHQLATRGGFFDLGFAKHSPDDVLAGGWKDRIEGTTAVWGKADAAFRRGEEAIKRSGELMKSHGPGRAAAMLARAAMEFRRATPDFQRVSAELAAVRKEAVAQHPQLRNNWDHAYYQFSEPSNEDMMVNVVDATPAWVGR